MKNKLIVFFLLFFIFFYYVQVSYAQDKRPEIKSENSDSGKHRLGENYGGGIIFWIDDTGQHGLISSLSDQSTKGIGWNPGKAVATGASRDELYSGQTNSEKIVSVLGNNLQYAARICLDFTITSNKTVYNDWYLPSKYELNLLYRQKMVVGGFNITSGIYWSSTESTTTPETSAWEQEFRFGSQHEDDKDLPDQVRCIRRF